MNCRNAEIDLARVGSQFEDAKRELGRPKELVIKDDAAGRSTRKQARVGVRNVKGKEQ